jgi:hypothetical protein
VKLVSFFFSWFLQLVRLGVVWSGDALGARCHVVWCGMDGKADCVMKSASADTRLDGDSLL